MKTWARHILGQWENKYCCLISCHLLTILFRDNKPVHLNAIAVIYVIAAPKRDIPAAVSASRPPTQQGALGQSQPHTHEEEGFPQRDTSGTFVRTFGGFSGLKSSDMSARNPGISLGNQHISLPRLAPLAIGAFPVGH